MSNTILINAAMALIQEMKALTFSPLTYDGENNEAVDEWTDGYNAALDDMRDIIYKHFPT